jgi:L-2-hydroxyglutarate oxidase LhgO
MDRIDCAVIGAGVVGLAVARALALSGRETVILEKETRFGSGISARNSEVIHAGLYYPPDSLKARLCVDGRRRLYAYCATRNVAHRQCGKLVVAAGEDDLPALEAIRAAAAANGVDDLIALDGAAARRLEPALAATAALLSPSTGILDAQGYMRSMLGEAQDAGAVIAYRAAVTRLAPRPDGVAMWLGADPDPALVARIIVNAAGLDACGLARAIEGFPPAHIPAQWYAKGRYFSLAGRAPFGRLIYPAPSAGGLGIHLTFDLGGQARFGPDVAWIDQIDYRVDPASAEDFAKAIKTWWPGLPDGALSPAYAGIRPKLSGPGGQPADFVIAGPETHGFPGIINLFGIESPGLTASLAIADAVIGLIDLAS